MLLFSNILSNLALISPLSLLEILIACFSSSNNFNGLHFWLGSDGKKIVFEDTGSRYH